MNASILNVSPEPGRTGPGQRSASCACAAPFRRRPSHTASCERTQLRIFRATSSGRGEKEMDAEPGVGTAGAPGRLAREHDYGEIGTAASGDWRRDRAWK